MELPALSRSILLGMLDPDRPTAAGPIADALTSVGYNAEQVRVGIRRLADDGLVARTGRGRTATLALTDRGRAVADPDVDDVAFAVRQDRGLEPWDGRWYVVAVSVPEASRAVRARIRDALLLYGAALGAGLYVSPHDWREVVDRIVAREPVDATVTQIVATSLDHGGTSDPRELAARLWPLDELAAGWDRYLATMSAEYERLRHGAEPHELVAFGLRLAIGYEQCIRHDPVLPAELLPTGWPGAVARQLLVDGRSLLAAQGAGHHPVSFFRRFDAAIAQLG